MAATDRAIAGNGLPGLTLAAVAREAGVAPATIVQRFGSKRGLLLAFAEQAPANARTPFDRARAAYRSPLAALRAAVAGFATVRSRNELANHLTFLHMDLTDQEFRAHAQEHAAVTHEEIAALLTDARAAGELHAWIDVDRLAQAVRVTYQGTLITWALYGDDGALPEAVLAELDTLLTPYLKEEA